jgi:hypothetical protein
VDGFAIAIRFLDTNGKRLKTEYFEVKRYEGGVAGGSERTFSVHISGPAGTEDVEAEVVSDITLDQAKENMRMLQEDAAKEDDPHKP